VEQARSYRNIYASVGVHPHHVNIKWQLSKLKEALKALAVNNKVVAIGECGLDYFLYTRTQYKDYKVNREFKNKQKELFKLQLELAVELNYP